MNECNQKKYLQIELDIKSKLADSYKDSSKNILKWRFVLESTIFHQIFQFCILSHMVANSDLKHEKEFRKLISKIPKWNWSKMIEKEN